MTSWVCITDQTERTIEFSCKIQSPDQEFWSYLIHIFLTDKIYKNTSCGRQAI